jgi:hypothetical protein
MAAGKVAAGGVEEAVCGLPTVWQEDQDCAGEHAGSNFCFAQIGAEIVALKGAALLRGSMLPSRTSKAV